MKVKYELNDDDLAKAVSSWINETYGVSTKPNDVQIVVRQVSTGYGPTEMMVGKAYAEVEVNQ